MKRILFALLCLSVFNACKKDKDKDPEPEVPAPTSGNLSGKVNHYDQFGTLHTSGLNSTTVSIEGQNFTDVTDASGYYTISSVPSNTYTLVFKNTGYGTIKRKIDFKFTDTTTYNADIADIPSFSISSAYAKDTTWFSGLLSGIYYNTTTSPLNNKATVVAIVGKSPNMTLADPNSYLNYATASISGAVDYNRFLSYPFLKDTYTFKPDSTLYMKIYPVSAKGASYFDLDLNKPVYAAYGTPYSTVFTLTIE